MNWESIKSPNINYFKYFTEEESLPEFYRVLRPIGKEKFNKWFYKNFKSCQVNNMTEISPSNEILQDLMSKGYQPATNQCHYNSQMACLLNDNLEFCTGFIINCEDVSYTHSFCIGSNNRIVDFTAKLFWDPDEFGFNENKFPLKYYGVKIEKNFLKPLKHEIIQNWSRNYMDPHLYEWYMKTCQNG